METKNNNQSSLNLNWLWGGILIALGGAAMLAQLVPGFSGLIVAAFFVGGGAIFFTIYLRNNEHWWALIPGYALVMIGGVILLATAGFAEDFIPAFVMFTIAFPFFYVYLHNRENWWALIPAYVMSAIGTPFLFGNLFPDFLIAPYVLFAIALPFFYVYLRDREHWWALIPAGIMSLIGLGLLMAEVKYVVPAVLIVVGIYLLGRQVIRDKSETALTTGPDADKPPSV